MENYVGKVIIYKKRGETTRKKTVIMEIQENRLYVKNFNNFWFLYPKDCEEILDSNENPIEYTLPFPITDKTRKREVEITLKPVIERCVTQEYWEFRKYFDGNKTKKGKFYEKIDKLKQKFIDIPNKPGVYVLLCQGKRIYVGETSNIQRRIVEHFLHIGGIQTGNYNPLKILQTYPVENYKSKAFKKTERFVYDFYKKNYPEYTIMM